MDLLAVIKEKAKKKQSSIVICEGWDRRCIEAASEITKEGLAKIILLGPKDRIEQEAGDIDLSRVTILDPLTYPEKNTLIDLLLETRKHKGMTREVAAKMIGDVNYFGCLLALLGKVDGVAGSAICSTGKLMRPALQLLRKPGMVVSEIGIIRNPKTDAFFFLSDISLNISPEAEQLATIGLNAAVAVRDLGIEPKVAFLSFSTKGSGGNHPQLDTIREAVGIVKKNDPTLIVDGELQLDAAVDPKAAAKKCPDSPLKGAANTLIFPNLNASNIFGHGLMQFTDLEFQFTILKGLKKPVGIVGRSTPKDIVRNVILSVAAQ